MSERYNYLLAVGALLITLGLGGMALNTILEGPEIVYIEKEVFVTPSSTPSTTIVQVNVWCAYLDRWKTQEPYQAAEEWINTQEPWDEVQFAMIEFARCSEFGKETARLIWPLWIGE
jgi:hypothetical protein